MKQILKYPIRMTAILLTLFLFSCEKKQSSNNNTEPYVDKCKGVTCLNGGTCVDGVCDCIDGYEGEKCEILSREKYLGTYVGYCKLISHNSGQGNEATVTIEENTDETKVSIKGLLEVGKKPVNTFQCTALESKFALYSTFNNYYVRGNFIDGNTNKIEIVWGNATGSRYRFEGERK